MAAINAEIRRSAYYDSVVLMQLQRALVELPGVQDAGVVMGTTANKEILAQSGLLTDIANAAKADDLIIVVRAEDKSSAGAAITQVDELLKRRHTQAANQTYRPKSIDAAARMMPQANWMLVSVPGQYAAGVAKQGLSLGKHIFLYSDNVSLEDEIDLKRTAAGKGLLVMGPDCGTALVSGVGLGFANRVRQGPIGVVAASGTGLQQVTSRIHQLGSGITLGLGTGGRDLSEDVGAQTALQGLDILSRDIETRVIVLISKPPAERVARRLLQAARATGKPVVVDFIGYQAPQAVDGTLHFARTLDDAAELAVSLSRNAPPIAAETPALPFAAGQRYLRGLFSGGTLAYEALLLLQDYLPAVYSNTPLDPAYRLQNALVSQEHTIIDLGEDEFTVGRLHPMMDNDLRIRRLQQEAADPQVAIILLDVVLGYGAHPDPASELGPAIAEARATAQAAGRTLEVVAVVVGTDEDPQNLSAQMEQLQQAGARVALGNESGVRYIGERLRSLNGIVSGKQISLDTLQPPLAAINVGLESFAESLQAQEAQVVHVEWRPSAGGNERLASILARMRER